MKTKETCICSVCEKQFKNITEHMLHYMKKHDDGYKEHKQRRQQTVTCGSCYKQLKPPVSVCECGHKHWSINK